MTLENMLKAQAVATEHRRAKREAIFAEALRSGDSCYLWPLAKNEQGYGKTLDVRAHRLVYERFVGPIPSGMWVLHTCDQPSCINPNHLFLGDRRVNIDDMVDKGRSTRGTRNAQAKLTEHQVVAIKNSIEPQKTLAERYGVDRSLISLIRNNKRWAHL